ncbi:MAG TPA: polysaccharide biosynthesis tyrosine autokinase [Blastocatellia bacterium]|nr:polysaccharide biosynthesis tyrosine autokinase [Blastocatellia bacterium]
MSDERVELERVTPHEGAPLLRPGYPRMPGYPESAAYGYGNPYGEDDEDSVHLRELWRMIRKRRWLIIAVTVIVTTLVTIEAYRAKSTYKASAFIEIGKETPAVRSGANGVAVLADDDLYYPQLSINTNLFRLTSEPLLEDVVADLKLDQNPKFSEPTQRTFWEAVQAVFNRATFKKPEPEPLTTVGGLISGPDSKHSRSPEEHERLAPFVGMVAGGLQAEQVKETRTLKVTYTHTDPVICAAVANGVAQDFIDQNFENKTERFTSASKWLDTTTRELMGKVERAEQDLTDYTKAHNIFATEGKETLTTDKLSRLHDQATRTETDRILKQSVYEIVKAGRMSELPAAFSDPKIAALQTRLDELRANLENFNLKYGQEHPQIVSAKLQIKTTEAQLDASRKALEDKLKGEYELAVRDEASLKAALERAKGEAVKQNQDAIQYNILKTEVDTAKSMYTDFLNKTNQAKVEVAQQHNNMRLIQPARTPGGPVGPGRFRTIVIGLFLSLIGGVGLAYFLEYLDNTIKTVEDVSRYVQLPALGVIPALAGASTRRLNGNKRGRNLIVGRESSREARDFPLASESLTVFDNRSSAAEAYRVVRTSMLLSAAGSPPRTILVTSGQAGEGKTTTVVNTAISLAQLGSSVLIIDCDLRRPATHKIFGINPEHGLSSYLSTNVQIDGLIQKLQIPNLSLLPCGPIPPNPAELISSKRMKDLLKLMAGRYDHILIDSPPLINVTDPVILSSIVDGVILVVHGGKSPRAIAQRARQELLGVGAKIFGVVLNNIDMSREGYDAYYYYYNRYYVPDETRAENWDGN